MSILGDLVRIGVGTVVGGPLGASMVATAVSGSKSDSGTSTVQPNTDPTVNNQKSQSTSSSQFSVDLLGNTRQERRGQDQYI